MINSSVLHDFPTFMYYLSRILAVLNCAFYSTGSTRILILMYYLQVNHTNPDLSVKYFISRCSMRNLLSDSLLWCIGTSEKRTLKK